MYQVQTLSLPSWNLGSIRREKFMRGSLKFLTLGRLSIMKKDYRVFLELVVPKDMKKNKNVYPALGSSTKGSHRASVYSFGFQQNALWLKAIRMGCLWMGYPQVLPLPPSPLVSLCLCSSSFSVLVIYGF